VRPRFAGKCYGIHNGYVKFLISYMQAILNIALPILGIVLAAYLAGGGFWAARRPRR